MIGHAIDQMTPPLGDNIDVIAFRRAFQSPWIFSKPHPRFIPCKVTTVTWGLCSLMPCNYDHKEISLTPVKQHITNSRSNVRRRGPVDAGYIRIFFLFSKALLLCTRDKEMGRAALWASQRTLNSILISRNKQNYKNTRNASLWSELANWKVTPWMCLAACRTQNLLSLSTVPNIHP